MLSPNNFNSPLFRSVEDQKIVTQAYQRIPILKSHNEKIPDSEWDVSIKRLFNMGTVPVSRIAVEEPAADHLPMIEGKMIHQYNPLFGSYRGGKMPERSRIKVGQSTADSPLPRYWFPTGELMSRLADYGWENSWLLGWRDICRATDERTMIATVYPLLPSDLTIRTLVGARPGSNLFLLLANFNSIVFDYLLRNKIGGTHLSDYILEQIPVIKEQSYDSNLVSEIRVRVLSLNQGFSCLSGWNEQLLDDLESDSGNPRHPEEIRAELDAFYAHLYGLSRDELRYILDPADVMGPDYPSETFRVLKTNEIRQFGEYRTQRLVLEAWDRLFGGGGWDES